MSGVTVVFRYGRSASCQRVTVVLGCGRSADCAGVTVGLRYVCPHSEAKEIDVDAVACEGRLLVMAVSEHVENAGEGGAGGISLSLCLSRAREGAGEWRGGGD